MNACADMQEVLSYPLCAGGRADVLAVLWKRIEKRQPTHVVTLNPEMIIAARRNPDTKDVLDLGDIYIADGVGIEWAARLCKQRRIHRYPGIDLVHDLMAKLARTGGSVFLLGGKPGVAEEAAAKLQSELPGLRITGLDDGYFPAENEPVVAANIAKTHPDLLVVGMGFPKQEAFIAAHRDELRVPLMIGTGGALEVFAGFRARAPRWMQRTGVEWAFRSISDITRLKRLGVLPRFVALVLREALAGGGTA